MKRKVALCAGIATLVLGLYIGSRLTAQQQPQGQAPAPQTRIAVVNLASVIKHYKKYEKHQQDVRDEFNKYETVIKEKTKAIQDLQASAANPSQNRDKLEADVKKIQRELQDIREEQTKKSREKDLTGMKIIYQDVEAMVALYAKSRNIELVLPYNDVFEPNEKYSPQSLGLKLTSPGCQPLYAVAGIDLTNDVIYGLDYNSKNQQAQPK